MLLEPAPSAPAVGLLVTGGGRPFVDGERPPLEAGAPDERELLLAPWPPEFGGASPWEPGVGGGKLAVAGE